MLSVTVDFIEGASVVAWHEHTLTVTTPMVFRVPKGSEWIIVRARVVDPMPEEQGLLVLTVDESPGGLTIPPPRFRCTRCEGKPQGEPCPRCSGSGQEPHNIPPAVFTGTLPPQRRIMSVAAVREAEFRLNTSVLTGDVQAARITLDQSRMALGQQPTAEALRAFAEALESATAAWRVYVQEIAPEMTALRVSAEHAEQRVRLEHRIMQLNGAPGAVLPSLTVELAFFSKNDNEATPLVQQLEKLQQYP